MSSRTEDGVAACLLAVFAVVLDITILFAIPPFVLYAPFPLNLWMGCVGVMFGVLPWFMVRAYARSAWPGLSSRFPRDAASPPTRRGCHCTNCMNERAQMGGR